MAKHEWFDSDIASVAMRLGDPDLVDMELRQEVASLVIHKDDAVALAKMFGLVVYDKDARL